MANDKVARLRQLMREAIPVEAPRPTAADTAAQAFAYYAYNTAAPLEQNPRARTERNINRIASWYGLVPEITRALDAAQVCTMQDLDDDALEVLAARMQQLEQCMQDGLDSPDSPVAR